MRTTHTYSAQTLSAAKVLGLEVARARRAQRWKVSELAERAGISVITLRSIERGVPTVALGRVFEVATLVGLFAGRPAERAERWGRASGNRTSGEGCSIVLYISAT